MGHHFRWNDDNGIQFLVQIQQRGGAHMEPLVQTQYQGGVGSVHQKGPHDNGAKQCVLIYKREDNMVQIGVAGKYICFSQLNGPFTGIDMQFFAGIIFRSVFFYDLAVSGRLAVGFQDLSVKIDQLNRQTDTLVKGFQHFADSFTLYNVIQIRVQ